MSPWQPLLLLTELCEAVRSVWEHFHMCERVCAVLDTRSQGSDLNLISHITDTDRITPPWTTFPELVQYSAPGGGCGPQFSSL